MPLGILTGLASEAAIARRLWPKALIGCAASRPVTAQREIHRLIGEGADALLSFGIAGALAPDLAPGAILIPDRVITADGISHACDPSMRASLLKAVTSSVYTAPLFGAADVITSPTAKSALFAKTGTGSVDMESGPLAIAAEAAGHPFAVLRAIADRADDQLPSIVDDCIDDQGRPMSGRVLWRLIRRPDQLPALLTLAKASRQAHKALAALPITN